MATRNVTDKVRDTILKELMGQFGAGYATQGLSSSDLKATPTGYEDLDSLLTKGSMGIAKGCICELAGSEGSGKSSLALRVVGNAQRNGELCAWFDAEAAFSYALAEINNCDPSKLIMPALIKTPKKGKKENEDAPLELMNVNEILEMLYQSVVSNIYGVIVLDSVAGLIPERILSDTFTQDPNIMGMGEIARSFSQMLGKIAQACYKTETTVIFINQLREKLGEYYRDRFHTPGGRALKFFSHQRISVEKHGGKEGRVIEKTEDGDQVIGHYARVKIIKNRMAPPVPPNVSIEIPIYYVKYNPDEAKKCYDLARSLQVITIRNGILTWKDENGEVIIKEEGESKVLAVIRENKLESRLAYYCVRAAQEEKNKSKKQRVLIPKTIEELAKDYEP